MEQINRQLISQARRIIIKIGSALLTANGKGVAENAIADWVEQMAVLRQQNIELLLVSSGAVAEGMARLGWSQRPQALHDLQAAAAIGQMGLVRRYESAFHQHQIKTAQILLTHADLSNRQRYLNARSTLKTLLELGVLPVVNENDVVATDEIRFGDNDSLAAMVANLIEADLLIILTDQDGLFTSDPRIQPDAELVSQAAADDVALDVMAGGSKGVLGRGGMLTKLRAARVAARSGTHTVIANGSIDDVLTRIRQGESLGTLLLARQGPVAARKRWLAGGLKVSGVLVLDDGAVSVLQSSGKSLLPVGVVEVQGRFRRGDLVCCVDLRGREIARGLVNYSADEASKIKQQPSRQIECLLGYVDEPELIHRDNLVLC